MPSEPVQLRVDGRLDRGDFGHAHRQVEVLDRHLAEAGPPEANPFNASQLQELLPSQEAATKDAIIAAREATERLKAAAETACASDDASRPGDPTRCRNHLPRCTPGDDCATSSGRAAPIWRLAAKA